MFPPFSYSPDNVDTFQAWVNRYLSHGNDLKMRGKGYMAMFCCCLAGEYLSAEYILRSSLEYALN